MDDHIATAELRITEVCTHWDAHLKTPMEDFRSLADDLNHRQPSTPVSFESIDDNADNNDNKDKAIHIILLIDDTNNNI